ncbi:MAG: DpnD/PcfM family protein, partial [Oscillospiraceae bacterium]
MKFTVHIEEHIRQVFEVEAEDIGEAMEIAKEKYRYGHFVVEPDGYPTAKLMRVENDCESTEWCEF